MTPTPRAKRATTITALVVGVVVVPVAAALFGVQLVQVLLLAALGATVCALIRFRPEVEDPPWWPEAEILDSDQGARRDVSRLAWSVSGADQQVGRTMRLRLHDVAARRLARRGVDLDDPAQQDAAIAAIGADAVRALDPDIREIVSLRAFGAAVAAVESLEPTPSGGQP